MSETGLQDVPGVGQARARTLEAAGYESLSDIADATVDELAAVENLDAETAACIRQGAKECRKDDDTVIERLASDVGVSRETVASDFESIAARQGTLDQKVAALTERYSNDQSVMRLEEHSLLHLYSLYIEGFETIEAVANAAVEELTEAPYITYQAEALRASACRATGTTPPEATDSGSTKRDDPETYVCKKCGSEFEFESTRRKHAYSCDGPSSQESEAPSGSVDTSAGKDASSDQQEYNVDEDIAPCCLSEYYEALRALRTGVEVVYPDVDTLELSQPIAQYHAVITSLIGSDSENGDAVDGYGTQQASRVPHRMDAYRTEYGNAEWVTDYQCLDVAAPEQAIRSRIEEDTDENTHVVRPVAPYSAFPAPIVVETRRQLKHALELIAEFPAEPPVEKDQQRHQDRYPVEAAYAALVDGEPVEPVELSPQDPPPEPQGECDSDESRLQNIPGVGSSRAERLRDAGYRSARDVAEASPAELHQIRGISETAAHCIHPAAKEECGKKSVLTEIANDVEATRADVVSAYGQLAGALVTPDEAAETLRELFDPEADHSVCKLEESALRYRHFLRVNGFETIAAVADASVDELTDVRYVGDAVADNLKAEAATREVQCSGAETETTGPTEENGTSTKPDQVASEEATAGDVPGLGSTARPDLTDRPAESSDAAVDEDYGGSTPGANDSELPEDVTVAGTYPQAMVDRDQWLLWKPTDDGRKVPRAPWETPDPLQFVSATDPENWASFSEAVQWRDKLPHDLELAFAISRDDDIVFFDLDNVVADGDPSAAASRLIDKIDSYTAISTSGTGVHIFARGALSDQIKSITGALDDDGGQTIEVYDRNRFIAMTGDHVDGTPEQVTDVGPVLSELEEEFATVGDDTPDRATTEPTRSRRELRDMETTSEIEDIFDAIKQTRPSDIWLRSTQTNKRNDGTYSYDPSWANSDSGTRLAVLEDTWIYRKGMIALDALQVVALEEGILADEREYPEGEAFWQAVEELRDRGAQIPRFEVDDDPIDTGEPESTPAQLDESAIAKRLNYGTPVRQYVHPRDRDYMERLALELAPRISTTVEQLYLPDSVAYRTADLYAKAHQAGIVPGAAHECTLGAALRLATAEAGKPRPLDDIAAVLDETPSQIRHKLQRLIRETDITEYVTGSDLFVDPVEYVPYIAHQLGKQDDEKLCDRVEALCADADLDGGSSPVSEVAAAFYVAMKERDSYSMTQNDIADAVGLSAATIRNNYPKFQ